MPDFRADFQGLHKRESYREKQCCASLFIIFDHSSVFQIDLLLICAMISSVASFMIFFSLNTVECFRFWEYC